MLSSSAAEGLASVLAAFRAEVLAPDLVAFRTAAGGRYSLSAREDKSTDTDERACVSNVTKAGK